MRASRHRHRGSPRALAGTGGARSGPPRREGTRTRGISGPRCGVLFLLLFPAPRANSGEVGCKVSEGGVGSSERGGGRGAGAGGENRRAPRESFVPLRGETWQAVAREGTGTVRRDIPGSAGGSWLPPPSPPSGIPHPPPSSDLGPRIYRPPSASSLYPPHPPTASNPKTLKSGMGKEGWGRRCAMGRVPPEGGCLLWNVDFFLFALKLLSIVGPHFSPIPPNLRLPFPSIPSKILKENG